MIITYKLKLFFEWTLRRFFWKPYKLKCSHLSRLFFQGDPRILKKYLNIYNSLKKQNGWVRNETFWPQLGVRPQLKHLSLEKCSVVFLKGSRKLLNFKNNTKIKKEEFINLPLIGIYPYSIAKFIAIEEVAIKNMSNWNIEKLLGVPAVRTSLPPPPLSRLFEGIMLCYNQWIFSVKWFKERPIQRRVRKKRSRVIKPNTTRRAKGREMWTELKTELGPLDCDLVPTSPYSPSPICCHFLQRLLKIKICWECHKLNE